MRAARRPHRARFQTNASSKRHPSGVFPPTPRTPLRGRAHLRTLTRKVRRSGTIDCRALVQNGGTATTAISPPRPRDPTHLRSDAVPDVFAAGLVMDGIRDILPLALPLDGDIARPSTMALLSPAMVVQRLQPTSPGGGHASGVECLACARPGNRQHRTWRLQALPGQLPFALGELDDG